MKFKIRTASLDASPYAKRNPLWRRWLTFLIIAFIALGCLAVFWPCDHVGKEYGVTVSSRLHNSEPRTTELNLKGVNVTLQEPIDKRFKDRQEKYLMKKIQSKINTDMIHFGSSQSEGGKNLDIKTTINEFYPSGKGVFWKQSIGRVALDMTARLNDSTIVSKKYHVRYASVGLDKDFEGNLIAIDYSEPADVVMGVSLRKTLDQFYTDLATVMTKTEATHLKSILFQMGSTDLVSGSESELNTVTDLMRRNRKMIIELDGYTDNQGDLLKDKELSLDRVKTVKAYLVHQGIKARRIKTKAFGAARPISSNPSEESRRLNRRVEFVILKS